MTAEKWVVPDPIQYELISLRHVADNEKSTFLGHSSGSNVCLLPFDWKCERDGCIVNIDEEFYHRNDIHHPIKLCIPQQVYILSDQSRTPQTIR